MCSQRSLRAPKFLYNFSLNTKNCHDFRLNFPLVSSFHNKLSSLASCTLIEWISSIYWVIRHHLAFPILQESFVVHQPMTPISSSHKSATVASLEEASLNRKRNVSFNWLSPAHLSYQNLVHLQFLTWIVGLSLKSCHPFLMSLHRLVPKVSLTS